MLVLVPCYIQKEVHPYSYFDIGVDISEIPGCQLLQQISSQRGSQKLLLGLVFHELTAYLSIFNLFKLNELWPYYQKNVNQITLNCITF